MVLLVASRSCSIDRAMASANKCPTMVCGVRADPAPAGFFPCGAGACDICCWGCTAAAALYLHMYVRLPQFIHSFIVPQLRQSTHRDCVNVA